MHDHLEKLFTVFDGSRRVIAAPLCEVAFAVKALREKDTLGSILVFEDGTGCQVDLDTRGSDAELRVRYPRLIPGAADLQESRGKGRPKLGVVAREVTLLPRHWEWLNAHPGGASVTLRRLVEEARHAEGGKERKRLAQERVYRFTSAMAGNEAGFEDAIRALYAANRAAFEAHSKSWPGDIRDYAWQLAGEAFPETSSALSAEAQV